MVLNDVLIKQNVITKIILNNGNKELPKNLKMKIMQIRIMYNKIKKQFDLDVQNFVNELLTDEYKNLSNKLEKTSEEKSKFMELSDFINSKYQKFLIDKSQEKITEIDDTITLEEYADIVEVNSNNNIEINNNKIKAEDFLEIIYELFVKEN